MIHFSKNHKNKSQSGFTAVELLITLFVAAAFLTVGYELYSVVMNDGGEAKSKSIASNISYNYAESYKTSATNPCTAQSPLTNSAITVDNLADVSVSVVISCPYQQTPSVSKIVVTVKYNSPQQTVSSATFYKFE